MLGLIIALSLKQLTRTSALTRHSPAHRHLHSFPQPCVSLAPPALESVRLRIDDATDFFSFLFLVVHFAANRRRRRRRRSRRRTPFFLMFA